MNESSRRSSSYHAALRFAVLAIFSSAMCSCQSLTMQPHSSKNAERPRLATSKPAPTPARIGEAPSATNPPVRLEPQVIPAPPAAAPTMIAAPCPVCPTGPAALPASAFGGGFAAAGDFQRPPIEEYVCNGGDQNVSVHVKSDWSVQGLHPGDTVVHYDTLDGKTIVEPSNEVCLYAPRFAAVRKVYGIVAHEQHDRVAGIEMPVGAEQSTDLGQPTTVVQPLQAGRKHSVRGMQSFLDKTRGIGIDNTQRAAITEEQFLPFEDLSIIRNGLFDNTEKARLAERLLAAFAWSHTQSLQVIIDNKTAVEMTGTSATESVYTYELPPGKSRLRVVKIASKQNAKPGELVEFTLRFDNVGDQPIGNVTVIDRLHDRLEYVVDSARCSLKSEFTTQDEDGSPRVLRWEVTEPLKVHDGGLIRFTCRVR